MDGRAVGPDATLDLGMASERDGPAAPSSGPMPGGPMPGGPMPAERESPARGTAQQPEVHRPSSERLPAISAGLGEPGDGRSVANATGPGPRPKDDVAETLGILRVCEVEWVPRCVGKGQVETDSVVRIAGDGGGC